MASTATTTITITPIKRERIMVPIKGTSGLIIHAWDEKAKRKMLGAQQGKKEPREHRNPEEEYKACFYRTVDGKYGFPTLAFKAATVGAARCWGKQLKMTELRQFLWFSGLLSEDKTLTLTEIKGEPFMREDMVTVGMGTDLRYRPEFLEWSAILDVTYTATTLSRDAVLNLIEAGGMGVGVGDWRVEKKGDHGMYAIDTSREVEVVPQ